MRDYDDEEQMVKKTVFKGIGLGVLGIFILIILFGSFYIIQAGQRGVLLTFGNPDLVPKSEGLHFKWPLIQKIVKMDIQTQKYEAELTAASKDLQDVNTKIAINYRLVGDNVPVLYRDIGMDYSNKIIYPLEQEVNKAITAQFTAEELVTKRDAVREKMKTLLMEKLQPRGIIVEEISIINFKFSDSFTIAIENKVTAEQNALAAKNKLEQIKYEAEQRVAQAEGEAKAIQIQVSAINAQGGESYVQLQAIKAWNGQLPLVTGGNSIPFINMNSIVQTNITGVQTNITGV
jgi:regulator of protease activity HflC (stomatin/prohibitin superfamily)